MITEQQEKAYEAWWYDNMEPLERDRQGIIDGFYAGWRACAAATANSRTAEPAHEIIHIARQNERDAIEQKLLSMAGAAFVAGKDDHAHWFRSLVNVLFKKPGDTSA